MYLKRLDILGFKSFAEKTRLEFEPGMTAIVGPNGCGKSNVADAIRWVLGEQSAKALRGGKMEDVIFAGTDQQKPMGMAEVSLTLADCEASLGMEYNEVTVTRRVLRSGEGQYFINKAPCRLKDIQRLFMNTGIGTNSYSIMEQGKIDRILSSRPEDRRAVFEEASGITKFKADRKEALRKLEHTEANLLRLDDIIREVKRQIISLQRQAGKARRFQTLREKLQAYDLYSSRLRLSELDQTLHTLQTRLTALHEQEEAMRSDIAGLEQTATDRKQALLQAEHSVNDIMEKGVQIRSELERLRESIRHHRERIQEFNDLSARDARDADEAKVRSEQQSVLFAQETQRLEQALAERDQADQALTLRAAELAEKQRQVEEINRCIHGLRSEQVQLDAAQAQQQNDLAKIDGEERQNDVRRERLIAETSETRRQLDLFKEKSQEMHRVVETLRETAEAANRALEEAGSLRKNKAEAMAELKRDLSELKQQASARQAQVNLLEKSREDQEGFPDGARRLMKRDAEVTPRADSVLGALAEQVQAQPGYDKALQTVLRPWMDALVLESDRDIRDTMTALERASAGAARLLRVDIQSPAPTAMDGHERLVDRLTIREPLQGLVSRLIGHVFVVEHLAEIPSPLPEGTAWVTRSGHLVHDLGAERTGEEDHAGTNPLARHQLLTGWTQELQGLRTRIGEKETALQEADQEESELDRLIEEKRVHLSQSRHELAGVEGEMRVLERQQQEAVKRLETTEWELKSLQERNAGQSDRRTGIADRIQQIRERQTAIRQSISEQTEALRQVELERQKIQSDVTELRVRSSEQRQMTSHLQQRIEQLTIRIDELNTLVQERSLGIDTYRSRIEDMQNAILTAEARLPPLDEQRAQTEKELEEVRRQREELTAQLAEVEQKLRELRTHQDDARERRSKTEIEVAQGTMRRQNLIERVTADYRVSEEEIEHCPEPAWEEETKPDREALETLIAELRAKIESIGPVNLVAIEEHAELEERYAFLTEQFNDLTNAKAQLVEMIKEINKTSTELFSTTFNQVNENFQGMFQQIFGGGTAKLILTDEGDILESGIEIIARPPGKKLQTVSLLSGGERTMTAVALLFSLYMVKPSPFCVLDELDAALDDANIGRFVTTVEGFLKESQFIVITHNRQTIAAASVLYGVTMEKQGISKIVSVKFNAEKPPATTSEPAPVGAT